MKRFKRLSAKIVGIGAVMAPGAALATSNWYDVTLSTSPVTTVAGVVIAALGATWAIRKVIKLMNRS